jgi:Mn2+/Fe2+ NRAMP family transporter
VTMYFIMLATASTLFPAGQTDINTAAEAAQALQPLAGKAAGLLFTLGIVGVGFLAVPVMISGAAYDLCQTFGWHQSLHARPHEAKAFYAVIVVMTLIAVGLNFLGFVRHEAAYTAVMTQQGGHNLVCCHQYPTQTRGWSNLAV